MSDNAPGTKDDTINCLNRALATTRECNYKLREGLDTLKARVAELQAVVELCRKQNRHYFNSVVPELEKERDQLRLKYEALSESQNEVCNERDQLRAELRDAHQLQYDTAIRAAQLEAELEALKPRPVVKKSFGVLMGEDVEYTFVDGKFKKAEVI